jgi:uncharacterized protein YndB with AHSA1/START domain
MAHEVKIDRPPAEVFAYATDARTWKEWHPSTVSVRGPTALPRVGDFFDETVRAGRMRGTISWRVTACDPPRRFTIEGVVDFPLMRATRVTITYLVSPLPGSSVFRRELVYSKSSLTARAADRAFFRAHNARQSVIALDRLKAGLET